MRHFLFILRTAPDGSIWNLDVVAVTYDSIFDFISPCLQNQHEKH